MTNLTCDYADALTATDGEAGSGENAKFFNEFKYYDTLTL